MSDELDDIVDKISDLSFWQRILLMIGFALASYLIIAPLILVLSIAQALFTLFNGKRNANLNYFSATLSLYVTQVIEFLTYLTDVRPFPFSDLPEVEDDSLSAESNQKNQPKAKSVAKVSEDSAAKKKPPATKKSTTKGKSVKKNTAKKAVKKKPAKKVSKAKTDSGNEGADNA